jgi:MFS family permease
VTVLRRPGLARLGAAGLLSEIGDWMLFIALPLYVLQLTGSSLVTATVFALELLPTVLAGPIAGVLIDRCDPWRLMSGVAALQAACLLPLLLVDSAGELWIVYVVVVAESVLGTVIEPCRAATAATLVPAAERMAANQALGVLSSVARLAGGPLGGLLLALRGIDAVLIADALTFLGVTALLLRRRSGRARGATRPRPFRDWAEGLAVVAGTPALRRATGVVACMALAQGAFVVLFVLFVVRDLGGGEADVGVLRGVQGAGALAGGALLGAAVGRWAPGRLAAVSLLACGALSLVIWNAPAITTAFGVYVGLFAAAGVPGLTSLTGLLTLLQQHAPDELRGRVMSTFFAVYGGVQAAGMLLAGAAGTGAGLTIALQVHGALYLLAGVLALRGHRLASSPWKCRPRRPTSCRSSSASTPSTRPATSAPARSG